MRTWRFVILLSLALVAIGGIYWFAANRKDFRVPNEEKSTVEIQIPRDFDAELERYLSARKDKSYADMVVVANEFASTQSNLWEACARRVYAADDNEKLAIAHFASVYYKRGTQQKEELFTLLRSTDVELVKGLVNLLWYTTDLGAKGEWLGDPLGGSEVPPHIARVTNIHHDFNSTIMNTLGRYRSSAKGEAVTVLRCLLTAKNLGVFQAKLALHDIDEVLYVKLDLGSYHESLTNEQRARIEKYLDLH